MTRADATISPPVWVVIVNYRTPGLTMDCLDSLAREREAGTRLHVVVTDNASGDDSVPRLRQHLDDAGMAEWVTLMPLDRNGGFAYGNNAAIRPALNRPDPPAYILLLNPDTVVRPGAIDALVSYMDAHPQAGIAGSRLEDPDGTPQRSAFRFHSIASEFEHGLRLGPVSRFLSRWVVAGPVSDEPCPTDWVAGASMMIRREVFASAGLLDENYFMYYEEVDFCRRASRAGWPCWYVPQSRVVHLVGQASGVTDTRKPAKRRPGYWFDSRKRYFLTHHGRLYLLLADAAWISAFALWRLRRVLQGKPDTDPPSLLADAILHSGFNPCGRGAGG